MKKLSELLQVEKVDGLFGIEVECEGRNLQEVQNATWLSTNDGSLRGHYPDTAIEWVLKKPLPLAKAITAVNQLNKINVEKGAEFKFSYRTSVHVHVNVQDFTEDQYLNFMYTYLLLEEPLIRFCGDQRKANRFCLSINNGEGLMDYLVHLFRGGVATLRRVGEDQVRYAAMNIAATRKYGSLEFRSMRGTLDTEVLTTWLIALNNIRTFAEGQKNVRDIHDKFVRSKPVDFFMEVLGDVADEFYYKEVENDLRNNFSVTLELAYAYVSPEELAKKKAEEAEALKKAMEKQPELLRAPAGEIVREVIFDELQIPMVFPRVNIAPRAPRARPVVEIQFPPIE